MPRFPVPSISLIPKWHLRMDELGCEKGESGWDCSNAANVVGFCNGPVCPQSPTAMRAMIRDGFPAEKISTTGEACSTGMRLD